jgi:LAO/AO transport system kinase
VQASKAGLLEIGDVFVLNKADRAGVAGTRRDLEAMLSRAGARAWRPPVVETVATEGRGIDELWAAVTAHREHLVGSGELAHRRRARAGAEVRGIVLDRLEAEADARCRGTAFDDMVSRVAEHDLDPYTAAALLLDGTGRGTDQ